jgi:2-polyprenyl-3-methyl-5-hydroxy-6-metoxy-1,4-benzoquinol methylase
MENTLHKEENSRLSEIGKDFTMFDKDTKVNFYRTKTIIENTKGPKILELGCADGGVTEKLLESFKDVIAVDASSELIKKAKQRAPGAKYFQALFEEYDPGQKFDTIILGHVLEHVIDPVFILKKVSNWLNDKGFIVLTVPNGESIHRRIGVEMGMLKFSNQLNEDDIKAGHRRVFTVQTLRATVIESGLNILKETGVLIKPLSNRQMYEWPKELFDAYYCLSQKLPAEFGGELCMVCERA